MNDQRPEIPVLTGDMQREVDRSAITSGLPSSVLMESAGRAAAAWLLEELQPRSAVILAGRGGNGGDALVVARCLAEEGVPIKVFLLHPRSEMSTDAAEMADRLAGVAPESIRPLDLPSEDLDRALRRTGWIVDGLFGSGLTRPLDRRHAALVTRIETSARPIASLDLPSGLPSDTGEVIGPTVHADVTIAMEFLKPAHLLFPARSACGRIAVARVAYPPEILAAVRPVANVLTASGVRRRLPNRLPAGHKGTFGRVVIVAGSLGMSGAAILCARGALRVGAGLVTVACPTAINDILETAVPEAITLPLPDEGGRLTAAALDPLIEAIAPADAVAVGPGLSRHPEVQAVIRRLLPHVSTPLVLDADGLVAFTDHREALGKRPSPLVLTPHPGELGRLIDTPPETIDAGRIEIAQRFAGDHGVTLLLKGRPTVLTTPGAAPLLNPTGNTGLATGGSGDVLTGMIVGLLAGGAAPADAAAAGAYLHGAAADRLATTIAERAITPSDLLAALPETIAEVERCS